MTRRMNDGSLMQETKTSIPGSGAWTPTLPSRASRRPPARSRGSARGAIYDHRRNLELVFESELERKTAYLLLANPDVIDIRDQPPAIEYKDKNGERRRHIFDFLVTFGDSRKLAIAVKPYAKAHSKNFAETLGAIAGQLPRDFADAVALVTERDLPRQDCKNAALLHSVAREHARDEDAENAVYIALSAQSETTIGAIVGVTGLKGRAYRALLRLIADGTVILLDRRPLDYHSHIRLSGAPVMGSDK